MNKESPDSESARYIAIRCELFEIVRGLLNAVLVHLYPYFTLGPILQICRSKSTLAKATSKVKTEDSILAMYAVGESLIVTKAMQHFLNTYLPRLSRPLLLYAHIAGFL